ncbi:MAG: hypothetical protein AAFY71_18975 [Bacteroidota bacterium]
MELQAKSPQSRLSGHDLVSFCKEKLTCAARDLAEFTKNGINAGFIVALAYKCDNLEEHLETPGQPNTILEAQDVEIEVRIAVEKICDTGRKIFNERSRKYQDYVIS